MSALVFSGRTPFRHVWKSEIQRSENFPGVLQAFVTFDRVWKGKQVKNSLNTSLFGLGKLKRIYLTTLSLYSSLSHSDTKD